MSTPINLNKVRKARARAEKSARADANAVTFGLTKAQRAQIAQEKTRTARLFSGKVLETPGDGPRNGDEE